jgi:hypothetical protein
VSEDQKHIVVATPMYGGQAFGPYMSSVLMLQQHLAYLGHSMSFTYVANESLIPRGRNKLVKSFLETGATHLFFIDGDIEFNSHDAIRMIEADKDVICGVYSKKNINWESISQAVKNGVDTENLQYFVGSTFAKLVDQNSFQNFEDPLELVDGGTGFMLIKREVFEKCLEDVPQYHSPEDGAVPCFFDTSLEPKQGKLDYISEDYHFCRIVQRNGMKVWAAPWCVLNHYGTYPFSGAFGRTPSKKEIDNG